MLRNGCLRLVRTGGLFDQTEANVKSVEEAVFDFAVKHVNQERGRRSAKFEAGVLL